MGAIANSDPLSPVHVNQLVPEHLSALIVEMLQKEPARRPTAAQVAERLSRPGILSMSSPGPPEVQAKAVAAGTSLEDRLDSWKAIAAYLGRGVRTVQRWEREEGLPVHRHLHDKRGSIYARKEELAAWWESRRLTLGTTSTPTLTEAPVTPMVAPVAPRLERVTRTAALTNWPALSSDARLIAYVSDGGHDGTTPQIWIQQIGGGALRLTNGEREYSRLSFSPDDTRIIFTATDESGHNVYEVPTLGGEPRLLQRGAISGQLSPDGSWLACIPRDAVGIRLAARGGAGFRTVASGLVDVACATWSPDSRSILVHARPNPTLESDWWVVPIDGSAPTNMGLVVRLFHETGLFTLPTGVVWVDDSLVFSAAGAQGVNLYRQRMVPSTLQPAGAPERLTSGSETAWLPTAAAGRLAFVSSRADSNLWSVALDPDSGVARGPLRRMTRGLGILGFLSVTKDWRTLAYFSVRIGAGDIFLRDLRTGSEQVVADGPAGEKGYPAISPSGRLLAHSKRLPGAERALRPIFIVSLSDGNWRKLGDDCGGRPREWVDERWLFIERFARLNSIGLIDTESGEQRQLLESAERSIKNARLSPDGQWIAFDAARPSEPASVLIAPFRDQPIPESEWVEVDRPASHPFWSADGRLLYYAPMGTNSMVRSAIRARHFDPEAGLVHGAPIAVYSSTDMMMPAYLAGTAPIATPEEIILVLGDFRGDVWLMDL
jgi:Tol biopolymer transport system component